jgi:hypothetical protein
MLIAVSEKLLQVIALHGEMPARKFLASVPRPRGDYLDFYPAAALLHAGYVSTDSTSRTGDDKVVGKLGMNTKDTAVILCQLMLNPGESFEVDGNPRHSWHNFPLTFFITAEGLLRLDELARRRADKAQKRVDYIMAFLVAVVASILSSYLSHRYASERLAQSSRQSNAGPVIAVPVPAPSAGTFAATANAPTPALPTASQSSTTPAGRAKVAPSTASASSPR